MNTLTSITAVEIEPELLETLIKLAAEQKVMVTTLVNSLLREATKVESVQPVSVDEYVCPFTSEEEVVTIPEGYEPSELTPLFTETTTKDVDVVAEVDKVLAAYPDLHAEEAESEIPCKLVTVLGSNASYLAEAIQYISTLPKSLYVVTELNKRLNRLGGVQPVVEPTITLEEPIEFINTKYKFW